MFDLAFSELLVIGIVALIVIGPERLPKVARSAGQWLGKLNRYVSQVKQDIDRDLKLEELRKMQQEMKDSAQRFEIMANDTAREVETSVEQETAQISKVMQAMSVTDGGLTANEWEKLKTEQQALADQEKAAPADVAASAPAGDAPAASSEHAEALPDKRDETMADAREGDAGPRRDKVDADKQRVASPRADSDYPDGAVG
jgi:sec-independent protein translocase protein TatB